MRASCLHWLNESMYIWHMAMLSLFCKKTSKQTTSAQCERKYSDRSAAASRARCPHNLRPADPASSQRAAARVHSRPARSAQSRAGRGSSPARPHPPLGQAQQQRQAQRRRPGRPPSPQTRRQTSSRRSHPRRGAQWRCRHRTPCPAADGWIGEKSAARLGVSSVSLSSSHECPSPPSQQAAQNTTARDVCTTHLHDGRAEAAGATSWRRCSSHRCWRSMVDYRRRGRGRRVRHGPCRCARSAGRGAKHAATAGACKKKMHQVRKSADTLTHWSSQASSSDDHGDHSLTHCGEKRS